MEGLYREREFISYAHDQMRLIYQLGAHGCEHGNFMPDEAQKIVDHMTGICSIWMGRHYPELLKKKLGPFDDVRTLKAAIYRVLRDWDE